MFDGGFSLTCCGLFFLLGVGIQVVTFLVPMEPGSQQVGITSYAIGALDSCGWE